MRLVAAAVGLLLVWCCVATALPTPSSTAQEAAKPLPNPGKGDSPIFADTKTGTVPRESPAPRVEESRPSIYYLPDKQGKLQPILDFKYEEFVDLYRLKNQLGRGDQPPPYTLQRLAMTGAAVETYAEITIQLQAVVRESDWVRIPLRLDQGLLRGTVQYHGAGKQVVEYEGEGAGYVCWIRGQPDSQHQITLTMLVPLDSAGDETRLRLRLPRAITSEMKLTAPLAEAMGAVSEGATLLSSAAKGKATEFAVAGLGGDFQLAWRKSRPASLETPIVLEATGTVLATLDGRQISDEATLSVRSRGGAFDRLTMRLPPEAELSPGKPDGYTMTTVRWPLVRQLHCRTRREAAVQLPPQRQSPRARDWSRCGWGRRRSAPSRFA